MPLPTNVRGAILEEIVLYLLTLVGYRIVNPNEEGTRERGAGLEVQGRGEWHQIDGSAAFDRTPAFMYPLRVMVEAKCYGYHRPVSLSVVRNSVGVLKDISENYFSYNPKTLEDGSEIQIPRFNYHSAIFSTSGYTEPAQRYAIAHQIFLIQYKQIVLMKPIIDGILELEKLHFNMPRIGAPRYIHKLRSEIRTLMGVSDINTENTNGILSAEGLDYFNENVIKPLLQIKGSYFGMLQGRWPMHLLSKRELTSEVFSAKDEIRCKGYGFNSDTWSFSPIEYREGDPNWFRLEFDLPEEVARLVDKARTDPVEVAHIKQAHFSYLDLAGKIEGIQRQIRLTLDEEWIQDYIQRMERKKTNR